MDKVYLFLANGFEEIEGLTVVDLLRRAGIAIEMISIEKTITVTGAHNIRVESDRVFEETNFEDATMLVLPGGMPGTKNLQKHEGLATLLKDFHKKGKKIAAICAAPSILGEYGMLQGKNATCYPGFEDKLVGATFKKLAVVHDGNIITSRGMGTSIEFAAEIIATIKGVQVATEIKESIIYPI